MFIIDGMSAESISWSIEVDTGVSAALDCVWMLVAYAGFISVVMVTGRGGSCGGPTISYVSVETILFFLAV